MRYHNAVGFSGSGGLIHVFIRSSIDLHRMNAEALCYFPNRGRRLYSLRDADYVSIILDHE